MQEKDSRQAAKSDAILERQLERLFSDAILPSSAADARQPQQAQTQQQAPATGMFSPANQGDASGSGRWHRIRWLIGPAATIGIILFLVSLTATTYGDPADGGDDSLLNNGPGTAIAAVPHDPSTTPTPSKTVMARATTTLPGLVEAGAAESDTARESPASPTPAQEVSASPTPTAAPPTPTAIPHTATASPTPTLARVRRVYPATATPLPAHAMGLSAVPTPAARIPLPDKAINIVLLGSDQRPHETSWRTDVVIVVSVNPELPSVSMLSIPRDLWLYVPNWTYNRINLADSHGTSVEYPGGGPGLVKATIEYNLGIHVDYYARVNFAGLMRIVDTLGGIDILLECPVEDGFPDDPITEDPSVVTQISYPEPGLYRIDGKHALWLSRSRYTTSEFARSRRQHRVLLGIWNKAKELGFVTRLPELWQQLTETVSTDLDLEDVLWLASIGMQLDPSQIQSGFIDGRYVTGWISPGGGNVLLPHTEAILADIVPLFNPYPYKAPQGLNQVEVWNASGHENWEWLAADKLLRNGFEVVAARRVDQLYRESVILDFTTKSKGSPLPLLQSLFNASLADVSVEGNAENELGVPFRLILGADYQPCERPTPAHWPPPPTPTAPTGN